MPDDDLQQRISATVTRLEAWCAEHGRWVSPDKRVREDVAAEILGMAPGTMRNRRAALAPVLPCYQVSGRVTYRLDDLAALVESSRTECYGA